MDRPLRVTAVCTGNICRSPMAEVVLRAAVEEAGLGHQVVVDSAGTGGWHVGDGADRRSVRVLAAHGYDGSAHRAQQITPHWFGVDDEPDLVLALDDGHLRDLRRLAPHAEIRLLREFDPACAGLAGRELDVPDPYYGDLSDFEDVLAMVEAATPGVIAHLRTLL